MLISKKFKIIFVIFLFQIFFIHRAFAKQVFENKNIPNGEIYEKLNKKIDLNLTFTNQHGKKETLKELFQNEKALIITLNYYKCTTMCMFQLVNLASALKKMNWPIGNGFRIATISFDPNDNIEIAKEKQKLWVPKTGQDNAKWDFYIGDFENINMLAKSLNFFYEFEPLTGEYSHAGALFFIKSDGTFYRYLYGIVYEPQDIKHALIDTSNDELGNFIDKFLIKFKKYQEQKGKYLF